MTLHKLPSWLRVDAPDLGVIVERGQFHIWIYLKTYGGNKLASIAVSVAPE